MNHTVNHRLATIAIGTALATPMLSGELYAADIVPELVWNVSKIVLAPAFLLEPLLNTNVLYGGIANLWGLLPIVRGPSPLVWELGIIVVVSYATAFVGVELGIAINRHTDWFTQRTWLASGVGTVLTVGMVAFVGMTVEHFARDPVQGQEFQPQPVAGAIVLTLLVILALLFCQARMAPE